jgi:hypothetical protein
MEGAETGIVHPGSPKLDRFGHNFDQVGLIFYPLDGILCDHNGCVYHTVLNWNTEASALPEAWPKPPFLPHGRTREPTRTCNKKIQHFRGCSSDHFTSDDSKGRCLTSLEKQGKTYP